MNEIFTAPPPQRPSRCEHCRFWSRDYGTWTATGWTGMGGQRGNCYVEPKPVARRGDEPACRHGEAA